MDDALIPAALSAALDGDERSLSRLVAHLTPVVQARVARLLLRASKAEGRALRQGVEDLTQEVFLALFAEDGKALRSWDARRGVPLRSFVGLIAERKAISILRSGRRNPQQETAVDPAALERPSADRGAERHIASRQLLRVLLQRMETELSPLGWRLFVLLFVEERSVAEIRREAALSTDAIYAWRSRLRRQAQRLRREIELGRGVEVS